MKLFQREFLLYALLVCTALTAACTSPGYNNNPSQQVSNAKAGCLAATDFFAVYFSLHVEPFRENQGAKLTKELFRSYCNEIPNPGKVFLTADLVGSELRKVPIGIRVVEQASGDTEGFRDTRTLSETVPVAYSKGVIESSFEISASGHYVIYLVRGGEDAVSEEDKLAIPLDVGVDSGAKRLSTSIVGAASGLALIGFAAFRYVRKRKPA